LLLFVLLLYLPTLRSFPRAWGSRTYSHGYLVLILTGWILWRRRRQLLGSADAGPIPLLVLGAASVLWLLAGSMQVQVLQQAAVPVVLSAWGLAVVGRGSGPVLVPAAAALMLVVPMWEILIPVLQWATVQVTGAVLWSLGISAEIRGEIIVLEAGSIRVSDSCAGERFVLVGLALGVLFVQLVEVWGRRALAVLALLGVSAMASNWIRVASLVIIGHVTEMRSGLIADHQTFSWIVFGLTMIPPIVLARRIALGQPDHRTDPSQGVAEVAATEVAGGRALLASGLAALGPAAFFAFSALPSSYAELEAPRPPAGDPRWQALDTTAPRPYSWRPAFTGADRQDAAYYHDGSAWITVDHLIFRGQVQGREMISFRNRIAPDSAVLAEQLLGPGVTTGPWVVQAVVRAPEGPILVWYWYRVGGLETAFAPRAKLAEALAFFRRRTVSELVAVSSACQPESCAEAAEALSSFVRRH
jgi:EpsI family protein